jgi:uncharacterized membrane protein YgdD (TMEM256/DUF423 family)
MMLRSFGIKTLLVFAMALGNLPARAGTFACDPDEKSPALKPMLQTYLAAYKKYDAMTDGQEDQEDENGLGSKDIVSICATRIAEFVMDTPLLADYQSALLSIDRYSLTSPTAIFDLAYSLQSAWELRFLKVYVDKATNSRKRFQIPTEAGLLLGSALFTGGLLVRPWTQPNLIQSFAALGGSSGAGTLIGFLAENKIEVPPPPAQLMTLAIRSFDEAELDAKIKQFWQRTVVNFSAMAATAWTGYKASKFIYKATAKLPGKYFDLARSGIFVAVGTLAYFGAKEAADFAIDRVDIALMKSRLTDEVETMERLANEGASKFLLLKQGRQVVEATYNVIYAQKQHGWKLNKIARDVTYQTIVFDSLKSFEPNPRQERDPEFEALITAWQPELKAVARKQAKEYVDSRTGVNFLEFLEEREKQSQRSLADLASRYQWSDSPHDLAMEVSAYLKSFNSSYLDLYAEKSLKSHAVRLAFSYLSELEANRQRAF